MDEWEIFRNNIEEYKGTITTWRFKIASISYENPIGMLSWVAHDVAIIPDWGTYGARVLIGDFPVIREDDWVVVTGEFHGVSGDGFVILEPISVINEGTK